MSELTEKEKYEAEKALADTFREAVQEYTRGVSRIYGDPEPFLKDYVLVTGTLRFNEGEACGVLEYFTAHDQDTWSTQGLLVGANDLIAHDVVNAARGEMPEDFNE